MWDAVSRAGGWAGGGMTPRRVDRAAVRARLDTVDGWIVEDLIDAFEPAALAAERAAKTREKGPSTVRQRKPDVSSRHQTQGDGGESES